VRTNVSADAAGATIDFTTDAVAAVVDPDTGAVPYERP
jgi:hypothetical protein